SLMFFSHTSPAYRSSLCGGCPAPSLPMALWLSEALPVRERRIHPRSLQDCSRVWRVCSACARHARERTGRVRHGRDTVPLDNHAHRRDNGGTALRSSQAMCPLATWRTCMTVHGMHREASIEIQASPEAIYDLVSDLPRMGEWSPENIGGEWQGGGRGTV